MQLCQWCTNKSDLWCTLMWGSVGGCDLPRRKERLLTHRLTSVPSRDWRSNADKRHEISSQPREREKKKSWGRGGMRICAVAEHLAACIWTDMNAANRTANPSRLYPWKTDARSDVFGVVIQQSCISVRVDSPWWAQPPVLWPCSPSCPSGHAGCWPALWLLWSASSDPISPSPACLSPLPGLSLHPHSPDQHTHKDVFNSLLNSCWGMNGLPHVPHLLWAISRGFSDCETNHCSSTAPKLEAIVWLEFCSVGLKPISVWGLFTFRCWS